MHALHLLIAFTAFVSSASAKEFIDVSNAAWYAPYVRSASESGIISGYADADGKLTGAFGPSDPVTLAEALKMSVLGAGYAPDAYVEVCPEGVIDERWFSPYICVDIEEHVMPFVGEFFECYEGCTKQMQRERWNAPAMRHEVAHMVAEAFRLPSNDALYEYSYDDIDIKYNVNQEQIEALTAAGIVSGDLNESGEPKGTFRPNDPINRAEMAKMIMVARQLRGDPGNGRTWKNGRIDHNETVFNVNYRTPGFVPSTIEVSQGTTLNICDFVEGDMLVVSSDYAGWTQPSAPSQCPQFKMMNAGTFHIHDQNDPSKKATIVVTPVTR